IGIVENAIAQDDRDVAVQAICRSVFLDRNDGRREMNTVIHSLFAPFPRTPIPGFAQVGKQVPPARAVTSIVGALRVARGSLPFARLTRSPWSIRTCTYRQHRSPLAAPA